MPCPSRSPLLRSHLHPARLSDPIDLDATDTSGAAEPRRHRALRGASTSACQPEQGVMRLQRDMGYSTGVALSQVLFDFGQNLSLIHAAERSAESVAADAATEHDTVVLNVEQAYFGLLASYRLRDVADETIADNQKHLGLAQGRFGVGLAPKFDVTQAQVQLASAELNQVTARNNVSLGRETLRHALGLGGPLDFDIVDALEQPPIEVDDAEALALAYEHRPELRSIRAQVDAAAQRVAAVESIRVADKGLQQARENLEIAEGRYRTDVGNIIELTDAQTSLT